MDVARGLSSRPVRLVLAVAYATAVVSLALGILPRTEATAPLILIALGVPFIFRLVPRNWVYGTRTLRTLRGPEERWYRQNVISGVVMLLVGIVWLAVGPFEIPARAVVAFVFVVLLPLAVALTAKRMHVESRLARTLWQALTRR